MEQLATQVAPLVKQLQELAPSVWAIAIRQAYINGIGYLLLVFALILGTAFFLFATKLSYTEYEKKRDAGDDTGDIAGQTLLLGVVFVVCLVAAAIFSKSILDHFLNPEWQAIHLLISQVKP